MNVVKHPSSPLSPDEVLDLATELLTEVIVIGITKDGHMYFDCTDNTNVIWLLEKTKLNLLNQAD